MDRAKYVDESGKIVLVQEINSGPRVVPVGFSLKDAKPMGEVEWKQHKDKFEADNAAVIAARPKLEDLAQEIKDLKANKDNPAKP